ATASASTRRAETGRPSVDATSAIPVIASARSTDGSQRVTNPKRTSTTAAAARPTEAQAAEERRGEREDERHVLPRDDEEVREAGRPEVVDRLDRLPAVVTEHEPGEQGAAVVRQRRGPGEQRAPHAVRQSGGRAPRR